MCYVASKFFKNWFPHIKDSCGCDKWGWVWLVSIPPPFNKLSKKVNVLRYLLFSKCCNPKTPWNLSRTSSKAQIAFFK